MSTGWTEVTLKTSFSTTTYPILKKLGVNRIYSSRSVDCAMFWVDLSRLRGRLDAMNVYMEGKKWWKMMKNHDFFAKNQIFSRLIVFARFCLVTFRFGSQCIWKHQKRHSWGTGSELPRVKLIFRSSPNHELLASLWDFRRDVSTPKSTQVDSKHSAINRSRRVDAVYTQFF